MLPGNSIKTELTRVVLVLRACIDSWFPDMSSNKSVRGSPTDRDYRAVDRRNEVQET